MNQDWSQSLPTNEATGELDPSAAAPTLSSSDPATPALQDEAALRQIQNRLFHLTTQMEHVQAQLEMLVTDAQVNSDQVMTLTRHLTSGSSSNGPMADAVQEQLVELAARIGDNQEQLATLTQTVAQTAQRTQVEQLVQAVAQVANAGQVQQLAQTVAQQEQIERLAQLVASRQELANLEETIKKLTRTQFKTNALGESKEQQVAGALATLQDIATRREQLQVSQAQRSAQQRAAAQREARAEFAAELLPALDSLELALENGATLLARQRTQAQAASRDHANYLASMADYLATLAQAPTPAAPPAGFWQRLFSGAPEIPALPPPVVTPPDPVPAARMQELLAGGYEGMNAWLQGLELVRERFVALLAAEGIQSIDALHKPFDPHLHVAVEAGVYADAAPNTVVRVLRKGYRQQDRVLRYAEVVVARAAE